MKLHTLLFASFLLGSTAFAQSVARELAFQPNLGQGPGSCEFVARGRDYALSLSRERVVLGVTSGDCGELSIAMQLVDALPGATGQPDDARETRFAYLRGGDPSQWQRDVPSFGLVRYDEVWPGIDVVYLGVEGRFRYDFHVAPHADPSAVRLRFDGVEHVEVLADGSLALDAAFGRVVQPPPTIHQARGDERELVRGGYRLVDERTVGFELDGWDRERELVIDPTVVWQTLIGSAGVDHPAAVRRAPNGNLWLVGTTTGPDFPRAGFGTPFVFNGDIDVFVSEFDPTGATLLFSALVGGAGPDWASDAELVGDGDIVVCGYTESSNFPALTSAKVAPLQSTLLGPRDAFVFRLTDGGSLVFSTYLGSSGYDEAVGLGVVAGDSIVVAGNTSGSDFPVHNAAQPAHAGIPGTTDGFVTQLAPLGNALDWSTYWGSGINDRLNALAVDTSDDSVVVGGMYGVSIGQLFAQRFLADGSASGSSLLFGDASKFNSVESIAIGASSSVVLAIETTDASFVTVDPLPGQDQAQGSSETVVAAWDASLTTLEFATFLTSPLADEPVEIATANGRAYVLVATASDQLPQIDSMTGTPLGAFDDEFGYLACIDLGVTPPVLEWASYLPAVSDCTPASVALDPTPSGSIYVAGSWSSSPLDVFPSTSIGNTLGVAMFLMSVEPDLADGTPVVGFGVAPSIGFQMTSAGFSVYRWDGTDTAIDVPYTVNSGGQAFPQLSGSLHFDAGDQVERFTLNWSGITFPMSYATVTLAPVEPATVDPNHASLTFMVQNEVKPPPPPPSDSSDDNSCCSVATVSDGTSMNRDLDVMRAFRDRVLSRFGAGRDFTSWYYRQLSPRAVHFLREHPGALPLARAGLWLLLFVLKHPFELVAVALLIAMLRRRNQLLVRARLALALAR